MPTIRNEYWTVVTSLANSEAYKPLNILETSSYLGIKDKGVTSFRWTCRGRGKQPLTQEFVPFLKISHFQLTNLKIAKNEQIDPTLIKHKHEKAPSPFYF